MRLAAGIAALLTSAFSFAAFIAFAAFAAVAPLPAVAPDAVDARWLVIADVHFDPFSRRRAPSRPGSDTNEALLASLFTELRRTIPNPPVVVIAGDFLRHGMPNADATGAMVNLARRFDRLFPHAQFVITLGNNDSDCGDYHVQLGGTFLHRVALAWAPLVDRRGAAPDFVRTFSRDGSYVARLPLLHRRAVVVNDIYDTVRYRDACGTGNPAATSLGTLARMLASAPRDDRNWIVTHVPPGIDAFSTARLAHGLVVVPFLRPGARERLVGLIDDPANRTALVITGHTHHFAFRLSDASGPGKDRLDVPILVAPSVSPIFRNAPAFLTLDVSPDGIVDDVTETAFDGTAWRRIDDLASVGATPFAPGPLERYQRRLAKDAELRGRYIRMYAGGAPPEIDAGNWRIYWCAATSMTAAAMRACTDAGGLSVFTGRGLAGLALLLLLAVLAGTGIAFVLRRRRRLRRSLAASR